MTLLANTIVYSLLGAVAVVCMTLWAVYYFWIRKWGFRELVKYPRCWEFFHRRPYATAIQLPPNVDEHYLRKLIDKLWVPNSYEISSRLLAQADGRIGPLLLEKWKKTQGDTTSFKNPSSGIEVHPRLELARVLLPFAKTQVLAELIPILPNCKMEFRKRIASILASSGDDTAIEPLRELILDKETSFYVSLALRQGCERQDLNEGFRNLMFEAALPLLTQKKAIQGSYSNPPNLLLALDKQRATELFTSPKYLSPNSPLLNEILQALAAHEIVAPKPSLDTLISQLVENVTDYPHNYSLGYAYQCLALHDSPEIESDIREGIASKDPTTQRLASQALVRFKHLENPMTFVCDLLDSRQDCFEELSTPQQHVYAAHCYQNEVDNGGHSQYFFNSSGDLASIALAGMKAANAQHGVQILTEAIAMFVPQGPSIDRKERIRQLSRIERKSNSPFEDLDSRIYSSDGSILIAMNLYAIEHATEFRR